MTPQPDFFIKYWLNLNDLFLQASSQKLNELGILINSCRDRGGKVIVVGNGGSAAIASHVAVDLTKVANVRAICFNESSILTCFSNDFGYENWVAKAIDFYADKDDLGIFISSSGQSENILNGAKICVRKGIDLVTFSGFRHDNPLRSYGNLAFWVDSKNYNHVETVHQTLLLATIDFVVNSGNAPSS